MKIKALITALLVATLYISSCKTEPKREVKAATIAFKKEGSLSIFKAETDTILSNIDIEIADNDYETQTGLMYRDSMEENQGMLFIFSDEAMHSFYMKNTKIALDLIYIDADLKIASFQENAKPLDETGLSSKVPVQYVLEVNAGLIKKWSLQIGDRVSYTKQ